MTNQGWRKSSKSNGQANCVEVAVGPVVGVRDTKDRDGGTLTFDQRAWTGFLDRLKTHRYDHPSA